MTRTSIGIMLLASLIVLNACQDECMVDCKLDGTMQMDTAFAISSDTTWIIGRDSVRLVYTNDNAEEMIFDVDEYRQYFTMRTDRVPCGECGDSVNATVVIPHFEYRLSGDRNVDVAITMDSDYFVDEVDRLLKCVEGRITFTEGTSSTSLVFLADCNSTFDKEEEIELNRKWFQLEWTDVDTMIASCPVDSGHYYHISSGPAEAVIFDHRLPIRMFKRNGECWSFDRTLPR